MKRSAFALVVSVSAVLATGCAEDNPGSSSLAPFRDGWVTEFEGRFPYLDDEGAPQISSIIIGGTLSAQNFANRGDVIVLFEDTNNIKVEMRRFTMAGNDVLAKDDFDALHAWAYNASGSPKKPEDMNEEDNCIAFSGSGDPLPWQDGCRIRVYYEGLSQLDRAGADLRVTLPAIYRHTIEVVTSDADIDSDYHNRGNVCVQNLNASADIDLGNGEAFVILAPDITPMPTCTAAGIADCESFGTDGSEAWSSMCQCINAEGGEFGRIKIDSLAAAAADIIVDVPPALWAAINLENQGDGQMRQPPGDSCGGRCDATVQVQGNYEIDPVVGDDSTRDPWRNKGFLNHPSPAAIQGAGYSIQLTSDDCAPVSTTEQPSGFVGPNNGSEQEIRERGNIKVCSDCIRGKSCDQLIAEHEETAACD
jgi:hypothetical protein